MKPGDFVLLFPHHNHRGYRASEGKISYYWAHFTLDNYIDGLELIVDKKLDMYQDIKNKIKKYRKAKKGNGKS